MHGWQEAGGFLSSFVSHRNGFPMWGVSLKGAPQIGWFLFGFPPKPKRGYQLKEKENKPRVMPTEEDSRSGELPEAQNASEVHIEPFQKDGFG